MVYQKGKEVEEEKGDIANNVIYYNFTYTQV